ncbi:uncharacterized protein LAESUDRAFT_434145 [Laetiporus sulphureus 93-53]|uniref:Uncharacterized protein n=1 Tax=Laetiporus sulphureus 93-53 TaxID=1314785 RepID=A0A165C632_9APHY|nr:uncharacterized protein LAESUDRAFT_434145 [Laetiporus sulphureus 93-53]KZT02267.1 hypothetical protein LAESUDRAFT_434145 [Laetiporus sulphureus 93-53]
MRRLRPNITFCNCIGEDSHMPSVLPFKFSAKYCYKVEHSQCRLYYGCQHHDARNSLAQAICSPQTSHRGRPVYEKSIACSSVAERCITFRALLLLNLLQTILGFVNLSAGYVIVGLQASLGPILISRVLLNVRAAARSTRGEQSPTPSFVRSQHGLQTQADVENMSFELNVLSSTEQAPETDRAHLQDFVEHDQIVAEPRSMANNVVSTAGDAQQDVNEEEGMDDVEEEMWSDWEDDE